MIFPSLKRSVRSFRFAFRGIGILIRDENNAKIHLAITIAVTVAGWWFSISAAEWIAVVICIGLVWTAEAFNTALEGVCNHLWSGHDERARNIKDISAAAVLLTALSAGITGLIIFIPKLF